MCNAYRVGKQGNRIKSRITDALEEILGDSAKLIRPTQPGPVLTAAGSAEMMRWGFHRTVQGKPKTINNTRSDKLLAWPWQKAFENSRCLIPISAFYEFSGPDGNKTAHEFQSPDGELLWAAGLWESDPERGRCYTLIMTSASSFVTPTHNRMPALLHTSEMEDFLEFRKNDFSPSTVPLRVGKAINPLTGKPPPPVQGELF